MWSLGLRSRLSAGHSRASTLTTASHVFMDVMLEHVWVAMKGNYNDVMYPQTSVHIVYLRVHIFMDI